MVVGGKGFLAAYRTGDGRRAWHRDVGDRVGTAWAALDGTVPVSTEFVREGDRAADVRADRVADGEPQWTRDSPRWQARIAAADDVVVSLSPEFQVGTAITARRLRDGRDGWSHELDDNGIPDRPVAAGGIAYVAPDNGGVHAFGAADGTRRWHYPAATPNVVGVAAAEDVAYITDDGALRVLDAATGRERWSTSPNSEAGYRGVPAVGESSVYLERGNVPSTFVARSRADGRDRWGHRLPETTVGDVVTSGLEAQPAVVDGAVIAYAADVL